MSDLIFPRRLRTKRLELRAADPAFADALRATMNDSYDFHRGFLEWVKPDWSLEDVRQRLHLALADWSEAYGEKRYFLFVESGELVGCIGLRPTSPPAINLGYWTARGHTRQGLMKEALEAIIANVGDYPLWLTTSPHNLASQRLAESVGFHCTQRGAGDGARWRYERSGG
ncbi:GNAT family N-acetyltransferase [Pseudomonas fontis]|uniref:GNAT family N-acetyltransferase n=1 Tax=Pseudomonas fontis TaxID=2942633 RepID=A0ABT5NQ96_9PSED|nr:GNAT family protein [Pseudomonas fontis]MDD0974991.1 GNAT family N-acetyltransferase [Pseudomonas fontis]MDD0990331.1 GNAT family N-acetyltransferase [Pseudomonas fontis]